MVNQFEDKKGLLIVIDDINGLSETSEFANWYKSFTDTLATSVKNPKLCFMLTGYPEKFNKLHQQNPSFNRIFQVHELKPLFTSEIKTFYKDTFNLYNISINNDVLNTMITYSSGMLTMMQQIGDSVFWTNTDEIIDNNDALTGVILAGKIIGLTYLQPLLDNKIRSEYYLSLFKKIGKKLATRPDSHFTKKQFDGILNESESKVFKDFIQRARKLGIIELAGSKKSGEYRFTNQLFPIYFLIQSISDEKQTLND